MLKNDVPGYKDNNTLENAIAKYRKTIIEVIEAESQIKIKTENNGEEKKNESLTHLRTVIGVLPVIKKTTETACLACADAFVAVAASLSCSEFSQAAEDFSAAAKEYANGKGNNDVDVIVGAIYSIAYYEFEKEFKKVKIFANN